MKNLAPESSADRSQRENNSTDAAVATSAEQKRLSYQKKKLSTVRETDEENKSANLSSQGRKNSINGN